MSDLISIIIPIYNVETYLKKCIESIIHQSYFNLEIILVDDGSTDKSGEICEEYSKRDQRIKVIHKANGGISSARNEGLKVASGEYICFVDSDDYVELDMYQSLYELIKENQADISMVSFFEESQNKPIKCKDSNRLLIYENEIILQELLINKNLQNVVWNKMFSKRLFSKISFPEGIIYEDIGTTFYLFEKAKKLVYLEVPKYHHVIRNGSAIETKSIKSCIDLLNVIYDRFLYIEEKHPMLRIYNAYSFALYMIKSYSEMLCSDFDEETVKEYDIFYCRNYKILVQQINEYEKDIVVFLTTFQKTILYMILYDRIVTQNMIREICKKEKGN